MKVFGNKETFAILYRPDEKTQEGEEPYAFPYCHLILRNQFIGFPDQNCYLGVWAPSLLSLKNKIALKKGSLREPEFEGLSDLEIFELIEKSNQSEEQFQKQYLYLPKLSGDVWCKYRLDMDETIDGFEVLILEEQDQLKFLGRNEFSKKNLEVLLTTHDQFIQTTMECLEFLVAKYPKVLNHLLD